MNDYFNNDKLNELEASIKTIPTDGEGRTIAVNYDEHFVRNNILKLIADLRISREENESQGRTVKTYEEVQQGWLDLHARSYKQIESLKAITELAVKGLKEIQDYQRDQNESSLHSYDNCKIWAKSTLTEIERLQNAQT